MKCLKYDDWFRFVEQLEFFFYETLVNCPFLLYIFYLHSKWGGNDR